MDPSPKTKGLRLYHRQWNLELVGAARLPRSFALFSINVLQPEQMFSKLDDRRTGAWCSIPFERFFVPHKNEDIA